MKSLAAEIARLPTLTVAELVARYRKAFGHEPPIQRKTWLWRRVAWRLQADERGGLSPEAKQRLVALCEEFPDPASPTGNGSRAVRPVKGVRRASDLVPGQILERAYKGRTVRVKVLEDGRVEHEGVVFQSLSAVAKAVTGAAWNGRLFFGITKRKRGR